MIQVISLLQAKEGVKAISNALDKAGSFSIIKEIYEKTFNTKLSLCNPLTSLEDGKLIQEYGEGEVAKSCDYLVIKVETGEIVPVELKVVCFDCRESIGWFNDKDLYDLVSGACNSALKQLLTGFPDSPEKVIHIRIPTASIERINCIEKELREDVRFRKDVLLLITP